MTGSSVFWYASRATGVVTLLLFTAALVVGLLVTSKGRWRPVHLLAYLSWPVAFAHCLGASKDLRQGWLFDMAAGCAVLVVGATVWRLVAAARQPPRAARVTAVFTQHAENSRGPGRAVREPTSR
jgi:hypothetical protein